MENQNPAPPPAQQDDNGGSIFTTIFRFFLIYFAISKILPHFINGGSHPAVSDPDTPYTSLKYSNILSDHDLIDFSIYLSENNTETLLWLEKGITYDFSESNLKEKTINIEASPYILNNGTASLIGKFVLYSSIYDKEYHVEVVKEVTRYTTKATPDTINLISGEVSKPALSSKFMHWVPSIDIQIVHDLNIYPQLPPQIAEKYTIEDFNYYPYIDLSDFWVLKEHLVPINGTNSSLPLKLSLNIMWIYKFMMVSQFEQSQNSGKEYGLHSEGEYDLMKKMFLETNPYFLGITMIVSIVHMVFEFLAYKNDIEFWRGREDLRGISTNLLLYNFVASIIIFLYLLDTGETSWAVWLPMGIGILVEFWKIRKGFEISLSNSVPFIIVKKKVSDKSGGTSDLDNVAVKYLAYILVPCMIMYSIYALYAYEHKSWYSWVIGTLASLIYTGGFIMMTPQLYINYKLKSVAHMPWKVLTYRALNTFIDDLFAFIIAMPTMHRLACFRDDIIFIIYLYQKWIYKVDPNRHYLDSEVSLSAEDSPAKPSTEKKDN